MGRQITVTEEFLDSLLTFQSRVLMGEVLKRFEIMPKDLPLEKSKEIIKSDLKELLPEWVRSLKQNIFSYNAGLKAFEFVFLRPNKDEKNPK
jgi:hypothetical protein